MSGAGPQADEAIAAVIMTLTTARGAEKSICPSEVARSLAPSWQALMKPVRRVAMRLAQAGQIDILRKGKPVALSEGDGEIRGVIRLRLRPVIE